MAKKTGPRKAATRHGNAKAPVHQEHTEEQRQRAAKRLGEQEQHWWNYDDLLALTGMTRNTLYRHVSRGTIDPAKLESVGNEITRVKSMFRWLKTNKHLKEPMEFGSAFKKPSARALRKHKRETGKKLYSANEVLRLIHECGTHLRAMAYLGINCGFGPTDCAQLPLSAVNLKTGWIDFPRPKTEVDRLCPLWPETVAALEASLEIRLLDLPLPAPPTRDDNLSPNFFLYRGRPWNATDQTQLSKYFTSVRKRILKDGGWYWLRHTFETVGGGAKDQIAVNAIMGHADHSMAAVYREEISPERLRAVTDYVRDWLFTAS